MTTINDIYKLHENNVDQILPNLWLGNYKVALDERFLKQHNIKYVVNVTDGIESPFTFITYYHIPVKDKKMCKSESKQVVLNYIDYALDLILRSLKENIGVLVHCRKGHHRSANIVLAFLMKYCNIGYIPASTYINSIRPYALRRDTCINKWLLLYYQKIVSN